MENPTKRNLRIVAAGLMILGLVWQHIQATRLGYEVEVARRQARVLSSRIGTLQMDLETSLSPAQLALQARGRLGMTPATPEALRILGDSPARTPENLIWRIFAWSRRSFGLGLQT